MLPAALGVLRASGPACLAEVVSVDDPDGLNRVEVMLLSYEGFDDQEGTLWARVAVPFAGADYGAFMLPGVGDEVIVTFVQGDPRFPVVIGSLWNGASAAPETLGGGGDQIDRWTLVGKRGTRIAIEEPSEGPLIKLETPGGVSLELKDSGAGEVTCSCAGATITIDASGVSVQCPASVKVEGATFEVTAGSVNVNAAMASFSGVVQCNTLIATTVVSSTYTPGAGNVW